MDNKDLENRFNFHPATDNTGPRFESIRDECLVLAKFLDENCPDSRELSLSITHLEEVMYWANASIARN